MGKGSAIAAQAAQGWRGNAGEKAEHPWGRRWWWLWGVREGEGMGPRGQQIQLLHKDRPSTLPRDLPGREEQTSSPS